MQQSQQPIVVGATLSDDGSHNEDLLKDVLYELDRERSKRAELEAQIRKLTAAAATQTDQNEKAVSNGAFVAMQTQVQGYQEIVEALTLGKPAIAAAHKAEQARTAASKSFFSELAVPNPFAATSQQRQAPSSLPLHVVRLLEVMPWDPRVRQYIYASEDVYEWQIYCKKSTPVSINPIAAVASSSNTLNWQSHIKHFPTSIRTLTMITASSSSTADSMNDDSLLFGIDHRHSSIAETSNTNNKNSAATAASPNKTDNAAGSNVSQQRNRSKSHEQQSLLLFLAGGGKGGASTKDPATAKTSSAQSAKQNSSRNAYSQSTKSIASNTRRVFTNSATSVLYDLEHGYPLPDSTDGVTWEWVGNWRISTHVVPAASANTERQKEDTSSTSDRMDTEKSHSIGDDENKNQRQYRHVDCDIDGWSYAETVNDFITSKNHDLLWDNPGGGSTTPKRLVRRRQWTRRRVLTLYPYASKSTLEYLQLVLEKELLQVYTEKLNHQLVQTKTVLTELEAATSTATQSAV